MATQKKDDRIKKTIALNPLDTEDAMIISYLEDNNINYSKYVKKLMIKDIQEKNYYTNVGKIEKIEQSKNTRQIEEVRQIENNIQEGNATLKTVDIKNEIKIKNSNDNIPSCFDD